MKSLKLLVVAVGAAAIITASLGATAASAAPAKPAISVMLNGKKQTYDQPPIIVNGATLVPLRGIFEGLGAKVSVTGKQITATKDFTTIVHTIGQNWATVDGVKVTLSQPSLVLKGRTLVPLRFIGEALDSKVSWNAPKQQVTVAPLTGTELQARWAVKADNFVWAGKLDKLKQMLAKGWKPAASEQAWINSVFTKNKDIVKLFLDNGANVNLLVSMENEETLALLEVASLPYRETAEGDYPETSEASDLELLQMLLAAKPDFAALEKENGSLLWTAVNSNRLQIVQELINAGVSAKSDGLKQFSAPLLAATSFVDQEGNRAVEMIELLLKNGADANDCNCDTTKEYTPLEYASGLLYDSDDESIAYQPSLRAVQLLLQYGADPKLDNSLYEAVDAESLEVVKLLLEKGADPNKVYPTAKETPLELAQKLDNKDLLALLL
ncbi:Ankyrin repeat [Paenibacillaceae bacterium GAS479]|nr:Ankyrin repeat [Paenibacillaceae bacterium GAS479]